MSSARHKPMTMAAFLEWEEQQPTKHEFDGFHPVAMAGGTLAHARIQTNLAISVGGGLRGKPCELHLESSVRYPDGVVVRTPGRPTDRGTREPVVIFEVLSPSTALKDRIVKAREYQATASVQRYVMLEQDRVAATVFARTGEGWSAQVVAAGETLDMPEIAIRIPLDALYIGVELPDPQLE